MKRLMIIPLVILFIVITSFPVSAITNNNDIYIDFYGRAVQSGANTTFHYMSYMSAGNLYYMRLGQTVARLTFDDYMEIGLEKPTISSLDIQCAFLVACDIYLCFPFSVPSANFGNLISYYDAESSFSSAQDANQVLAVPFSTSTFADYPLDSLSVSTLPGTDLGTRTWYFYKFNDVPAGSYVVSVPVTDMIYYYEQFVTSPWYIGFGFIGEQIPDDSGSSSSTPIGGGSGSGGSGEGNTYLDPWYSPDADLQTNVSAVQDTLDSAIASAGTVFEQIFYAVYASYQLEKIVYVSDQQNVQQTQVFNNSLSNVVSNYQSGSVDYSTALDQMSSNYRNALQTAETPEQGDYITAVYQAKQQELHYNAVYEAGEKVKDIISDEDMQEAEDYFAAENELVSQFELQKLEDAVDYRSWFNLLSVSEAATYRTILDFFLNDAIWRYWIIVPMTMIIVTLIMGTASIMVTNTSSRSGGRKK